MFWTFDEIKASNVKNIAGACPSDDEFMGMVNECGTRLLRRGDWADVVVPIQVCSYAGCAVFPRYVKNVRKMNLCGCRVLPVNGLWWQFLDTSNRHEWGGWFGRGCNAQQTGKTPTFSDIWGDGRLVRAYCDRSDIGKVIQLFGIDNNNQPLQTKNADGTWSDGISLTLALPFVSTSMFIRRIDRVIKPVTNKRVMFYGFNQAANVLEDIATYEPSETNPQYQKFNLNIPRCNPSPTGTVGACGSSLPIIALVKLQFLPVMTGTDLVLFPPDAIKEMYQSLRFAESGDVGQANAYEARAIRELNLELNELLNWDDAMPVTNEPFSNTGIGFQQCF